MKKVCALIGKYFGVLAVIFLIIGMTLPTSFSWVLGKVGGVSVLSVLLGIIMFGMGMTIVKNNIVYILCKDILYTLCKHIIYKFLLIEALIFLLNEDRCESDKPVSSGILAYLRQSSR
jgi:BASS family bile acid:Na+ symporter